MMDAAKDCNANFNKIIPELAALVDPGYGGKRSKDREIAVTEFIWEVLRHLEEDMPQLKISELLPVGSYNEGTKIVATNEFDFLAVVDELSQPGAVKVVMDDDTNLRTGTVKLKLGNEEEKAERWRKFCKRGYLRCFEAVQQGAIEDSFGRHVMMAIPKLRQNRNRNAFRQNNELTYLALNKLPKLIYYRARPVEQVAIITNALAKHPNILLTFVFDGEEVTADLCPAIRYHDVKDCFNPELCTFEKLATEVVGRGSVLLVGQEHCLFRVTYTETEVDYMKNKMHKCHKQLYILFKMIAYDFSEYKKPFSSYAVKVICIRHDLLCKNAGKENGLLQCFDEILNDLIQALSDCTLLSVFDKRLDLFSKTIPGVIDYRRKYVIPALNRISDLFHNGAIRSADELRSELQSIARSTEDGYYKKVRLIF